MTDDVYFGGPSSLYPFGVTQTINRANVEIYGVELSAHYYDESGWHGWGTFGTYVGKDIDEDLNLNTIPAAKVVLGVGYATETWGTDAIITAAAARDLGDVENLASTTPSYTLLDLTAWWSPAQVKGLTLRAGIYNIFDETYYEDGLDITASNKEYFSEPGRNARVSATYKF
jgi:hemoglobin/transferrin/lactoferrin receptor protein